MEDILYSYAKTQEEQLQVAQLRAIAYSSHGKIKPVDNYIDLLDEYDSRSAISTLFIGDKLIASGRTIFNDDSQQLSYLKHINYRIPELPANRDLAELSRTCVHPDYNGKGLFWPLAARMVFAAIEGQRNYCWGAATEDLCTM